MNMQRWGITLFFSYCDYDGMMMVREECPRVIKLPVIRDPRGALAVIHHENATFKMERVYFLFDLQSGSDRGGHAHKSLIQLMIAVSGSFKVNLDDGVGHTTTFEMRNPVEALLIPPGYWRTIYKFSSGAVCLVLASEAFRENDYIREYSVFCEWKLSR